MGTKNDFFFVELCYRNLEWNSKLVHFIFLCKFLITLGRKCYVILEYCLTTSCFKGILGVGYELPDRIACQAFEALCALHLLKIYSSLNTAINRQPTI